MQRTCRNATWLAPGCGGQQLKLRLSAAQAAAPVPRVARSNQAELKRASKSACAPRAARAGAAAAVQGVVAPRVVAPPRALDHNGAVPRDASRRVREHLHHIWTYRSSSPSVSPLGEGYLLLIWAAASPPQSIENESCATCLQMPKPKFAAPSSI